MKKIVIILFCILSAISVTAQNRTTRQSIHGNTRGVSIDALFDFRQENPDGTVVTGNHETNLIEAEAPCIISFKGSSTDLEAYFYTWIIYKDDNKENPIVRYTDQDINYTFDKAGNYVVELEVADNTSTNSATAKVNVNIATSVLDPPNYFSPNSSPGQNDEFRVKHKSLVKFKCTIFNRWGVKLYQWNDPDKGWDGKYKGKMVKPGVYFYVIEALGADGIRYKKMGDINIL